VDHISATTVFGMLVWFTIPLRSHFCPSVDLGINFLMSANSVPSSPYFLLYSKVRDIKMGSQSPLSRPPNQMILIKSPPLPPPVLPPSL
jgi:hypothetical protein